MKKLIAVLLATAVLTSTPLYAAQRKEKAPTSQTNAQRKEKPATRGNILSFDFLKLFRISDASPAAKPKAKKIRNTNRPFTPYEMV